MKIDEGLKYKENKLNNEEATNKQHSFFYEGKAYNYSWYTVLVSQCFWKAQDAIFVLII